MIFMTLRNIIAMNIIITIMVFIILTMKQDPENHGNKELMAAVTGALWKLSMSEDNVKCFQVFF